MMGWMKKRRISSKQPLFDVVDSFERSLSKAREERGEPNGGPKRAMWLGRRWMGENPGAFAGLSVAAAALGLLAWWNRERLGWGADTGQDQTRAA